jgi:uncharacterized protein
MELWNRWSRGLVTLLLGMVMWGVGLGSHAASVIAVPALQARVTDTSGTLQAEEIRQLEAELAAIETDTGSQLVIWLLPSSGGEDIAALANRVANEWKVGRKLEGDGLLILVAKNDRRIRIEVAKALEGAIPDVMAGRVIQQQMAPRFAAGDYLGGLRNGVAALASLIKAEELPAPQGPSGSGAHAQSFNWVELGVFIFFASAIGGTMARRALGTRLGSAVVGVLSAALVFYVTQWWLSCVIAGVGGFMLSIMMSRASTRSMGHHASGLSFGTGTTFGHDAGGSSSGSFSSGGGGNFGGGGASGGW